VNPAGDDEMANDAFVEEFARLAQERLTGEAPSRDRQSFSRLEERLIAERLRERRSPWVRASGVALAAVVVLGVGTWAYWAAHRITFRVEGAELAADGKLFGGTKGAQLHFSDGSELALAVGL